jgi:hypothetical protein
MHIQFNDITYGIILGGIATVLFDIWLIGQKLIGRRILNFRLLGRWIGHFRSMKFAHTNIAHATEIPLEFLIGLIGHYAIGIAIAELLLLVSSRQWLVEPDIYVALAVGVSTVVLPLLIMQPSMGGGVAFTKTATPLKSCLNSVLNHFVFGLCLYMAAIVILMFR